jgi:hypothetical protein
LNFIDVISQLRNKGLFITVKDFISAKSLGEVASKLKYTEDIEEVALDMELKSYPLLAEHKDTMINMITTAFYEKGELEKYILDEELKDNFYTLLSKNFNLMLKNGLCFAVKDSKNKIVGFSLSFDQKDNPEMHVNSKLDVILEMLDYLESSAE